MLCHVRNHNISINRIVIVVVLCLLSGCGQIAYYAQAAKGQLEIITSREPVSQLLADKNQPADLTTALERARDIRDFASSHLGLPDNKTFRYYSDLKRPYVVWNVVATPSYSLSPKTWCFPVAGCVAYKGYFAEQNAVNLNQSLKSQGYDTYLYGVPAYSTLGRLSDPLLNTFIHYNDISLAGLIFHELAHQVVYVQDDSEFNEAFATAVQIEGLRQWLSQTQPEEVWQKYQSTRTRNDRITEMVLSFRKKLIALYKSDLDEQEMEKQKSSILQSMKENYQQLADAGMGSPYYDWWFTLPLNNAYIASVATYHRLVPTFSRLIEQAGNLEAFYKKVEMLAKLDKNERDQQLREILPGS